MKRKTKGIGAQACQLRSTLGHWICVLERSTLSAWRINSPISSARMMPPEGSSADPFFDRVSLFCPK